MWKIFFLTAQRKFLHAFVKCCHNIFVFAMLTSMFGCQRICVCISKLAPFKMKKGDGQAYHHPFLAKVTIMSGCFLQFYIEGTIDTSTRKIIMPWYF